MSARLDVRLVRGLLERPQIELADLEVCCRATASAFGADGAALTLVLPGTVRAVIAAADETSRLLEQAQLTTAEGPCTVASWTGRPVSSRDLRDPAEDRWPMLTAYVRRLPVRAVLAVPLLPVGTDVGGHALGSMDLWAARPGALDDVDLTVVTALAGLVADAVLHLSVSPATGAAFRHAPWAAVHQATAAVARATGLSGADAVTLLRAVAVRERRWLTDVAAEVADGSRPADLRPPPD